MFCFLFYEMAHRERSTQIACVCCSWAKKKMKSQTVLCERFSCEWIGSDNGGGPPQFISMRLKKWRFHSAMQTTLTNRLSFFIGIAVDATHFRRQIHRYWATTRWLCANANANICFNADRWWRCIRRRHNCMCANIFPPRHPTPVICMRTKPTLRCNEVTSIVARIFCIWN